MLAHANHSSFERPRRSLTTASGATTTPSSATTTPSNAYPVRAFEPNPLGTVMDAGAGHSPNRPKGPTRETAGNTRCFGGHFLVMRRAEIEPQVLFESLYRDFGPEVLAFCRRRVDADLADDATAETFVVVWRRLAEVPRQPRGWLLGIARWVLANQWRSARRRDALVTRLSLESPDQGVQVDGHHPVLEALSSLSDLDQETLLLAAWDGLNSTEAAQVLGCTAIAFRLRLHRARGRLMQQLDAQKLEAGQPVRRTPLPKEETT